MRTLAFALLVPLTLAFASASHTPRDECSPSSDAPATGIIQFTVDGDTYYVIDDNDGDAVGPHVYEETNGIGVDGDVAHSVHREDGHAGDLHPDLPEGCEDPLVAPDRHVH